MVLTTKSFAKLVDVSVVRADVDYQELTEFAQFVRQYGFVGAHPLPCFVRELAQLLHDLPEVLIGGVVGFPFGANRTDVKLLETRLAIEDGAKEIDIVQNIGFLRSSRDKQVEHEIREVVEAAFPCPVKVIIETAYLSDIEIVHACRVADAAGAAFVKTGTGHAPLGATVQAVRLMRESVGSHVQVKAAGGITNLEEFARLYRAGARRFGIGLGYAQRIIEELETYGSEGYEM